MTQIYVQIPPPESLMLDNPAFASLASTDLAAEAAAREASQVSAKLAAAALSLTNLRPEAMPELLQRP